MANREFPGPPLLKDIEIELGELLECAQYTYLDDDGGAPDSH